MVLYKYKVEVVEVEISKRLKRVIERNFAKNIGKTAKQFRLSGLNFLFELAQLHKMMPFLKQFKYVYLTTSRLDSPVGEVKVDWSGWYQHHWDDLDPRIIHYVENTIKPERAKAGVYTKDDPDGLHMCARSYDVDLADVFVEVLDFDLISSELFVQLKAEELPEVKVTHLPVMIGNDCNNWVLKPISEVATEDFYPESLISLFAPAKKKEQQKVNSEDTMDILISAEQKLK